VKSNEVKVVLVWIKDRAARRELKAAPRKPYWLKANFKSKRDRDLRFVANWPPRKTNVTSPGGKLETRQILSYREKIPFVSFWAGSEFATITWRILVLWLAELYHVLRLHSWSPRSVQ